jgi:hypothetical protein
MTNVFVGKSQGRKMNTFYHNIKMNLGYSYVKKIELTEKRF